MTAPERTLIDRARDVLTRRITDEYPGWQAGHDAHGWHAQRLDDGYGIRAEGPDGLRALIEVAPPVAGSLLTAELRRRYRGWHIWSDNTGWHARRRGNFRQERWAGAPLYAVHEPDVALLRQRLEEQDRLGMAGRFAASQ